MTDNLQPRRWKRAWPWGRDNVLATGEVCKAIKVRRGLTPQQNYRRERIRWALLGLWLPLVPRRLRTWKPLRGYFWQQAEVEKIDARAKQLAKEHGWL